VPGRAAYVDGRGGSSLRLNFSGVDEERIREGVRRLGEVVREQVALYGTLTGVSATPKGAAPAAPTESGLAEVLQLPAPRARSA
jgi:2-aminoadipate transaminase